MVGSMVSPGCMKGGTSSEVARSSGERPAGHHHGDRRSEVDDLVRFQDLAVGVGDQVDEELAAPAGESRGPGRQRERLGDLLEAVLRNRRRLERADGDLAAGMRRGVITTATVDAGASAVVTLPGAWAIGLVIVLVPVLSTVAVTPSVPPQAARMPTEPVIDSSGSENPRGENAMSSRGSSRSGAARLVRRRARRSGRGLRESLGTTEHLPEAGAHRRPAPCGRTGPIPDRELG